MSFETLPYLNSFTNFEHLQSVDKNFSFSLDRIQKLLEFLDNPQKKYPSLHIAGTNGKGATAIFSANLLRNLGYKVGLYTSPHLFRVNERICVDAKEISDEKLKETLKAIKPFAEKIHGLTYFEMLTTCAFYYFSNEKIDFAIIETGLGGRLDATNVNNSDVCAITSIGLEHTKILGDTLSKIATEKAAIIKSTTKGVIVGLQEKEALEIIEERCQEFGIVPKIFGRDFNCTVKSQSIKGLIFDVQTEKETYQSLKINFLGEHQAVNGAVAISMIESLGLKKELTPEITKRAFLKVVWPGRGEILSKEPLVFADSAHNPQAAQTLVKAIRDVFPDKEIILVFGASKDKDIKKVCEILSPVTEKIILTRSAHPRSFTFDKDDAKDFFQQKEVFLTESVSKAMERAFEKREKQDMIVVTGSIFVVAEAIKYVQK